MTEKERHENRKKEAAEVLKRIRREDERKPPKVLHVDGWIFKLNTAGTAYEPKEPI